MADKKERMSDSSIVETVIRIGLLLLLLYWSLQVIGPFLTIALWSAVLTVILYPLFGWLARRLRRRTLAAALITIACLLIVLGPVTWLGFGAIGGIEYLANDFDANTVSIPLPAESVKHWPVIGEQAYATWTEAATDTKAMLKQFAPKLKPLGGKLLSTVGTITSGLLQLIAAIIIAGFLYSPGPRMVESLRALLRHILGERSDEILKLTGNIIQNVARGVVGVALTQALLAGLGFKVAGVPGAALLTVIALFLGLVQIGPSVLLIPVIIWSWTSMPTAKALLFTLYMIPVSLLDNIAKPLVMARGLTTPTAVIFIGVIGGTIAYGISGLFVGPIILAVAWALLTAWLKTEDEAQGSGEKPARR